jgi:hypothetical protein
MKTLLTVVAAVAVVALGAVGGFDYASQGKIGLLPSCVTGQGQKSDCTSGGCCPRSQEEPSTSYCPECGDEDTSSCPNCCSRSKSKTSGKKSKPQQAADR